MATKKKNYGFGNAVTGANKGTTPLPISAGVGAGPPVTAGLENQDPATAGNPWGVLPSEPVDNSNGPGGGSAAPEPYNPDTDPVYAAYIASLDLKQAQQTADTARRRAYLEADQATQLDASGRSGDTQKENIAGNYESRGLFNSGGRLRDLARQSANQTSRENQIRESTTRGSTDLETQLANSLAQAQLQRQQARLGIFT